MQSWLRATNGRNKINLVLGKLLKITSDIKAIDEYLTIVESGCFNLTPSKKQRVVEGCKNWKKELVNEAATMHLILGPDAGNLDSNAGNAETHTIVTESPTGTLTSEYDSEW